LGIQFIPKRRQKCHLTGKTKNRIGEAEILEKTERRSKNRAKKDKADLPIAKNHRPLYGRVKFPSKEVLDQRTRPYRRIQSGKQGVNGEFQPYRIITEGGGPEEARRQLVDEV